VVSGWAAVFSFWIKRWTLRILLQAVPCGAAQLTAFQGVS